MAIIAIVLSLAKEIRGFSTASADRTCAYKED